MAMPSIADGPVPSPAVFPLAVAGTLEPTRPSWLYRGGLTIIAIAMLMLPLIYLSVIVGAAAFVWWHVTTNTWILESVSNLWGLLGYAAPAVVGVALVFFMIKPVLARPARRYDPVPVSRDDEPVLFAFIEQVCGQVRAPMPRRVQVDCQVNASAGFLPGRLGVLKRDLVLTLGLPLAAGLSIREFGGVLAHEFGHFAQGTGMRLTSLVRGINAWFARVVYERDHWDERLETWSRDWDWRAAVVLVIARGSIWLSRRLLFGLMMAGHAISCFMLRQMEYDADSYEIKFAGSEAFARTSARMRQLNAGARFGYNDLRHSWQQRALPADFPAFLVDVSNRMPHDVLAEACSTPASATRLLDTHPSDADRLRAAEAAASAGILVGGDDPATLLFRRFDALSAEATRHHYAHDLGLDLTNVSLVGTAKAVEKRRRRENGLKAVEEFFGESISECRPLRLPFDELRSLADEDLRTAAVRARDTMAACAADAARRYRLFERLAERRDRAFAAEEAMTAGLAISDPETWDLNEPTPAGAASAIASALQQQGMHVSSLERFETAAARHLAAGLVLAGRRPADLDIQSSCDLFNAVGGALPRIHDARRLVLAVTILSGMNSEDGAPPAVGGRLRLLVARINKSFDEVRQGLEDLTVPMQLAETPMSAVALCGLQPNSDAASPPEVIERVSSLYLELLGQLVIVARAELP
jgi:Zn-dependent protease with chaperone function